MTKPLGEIMADKAEMVAGPEPIDDQKVYLTLSQGRGGVQLFAKRGGRTSILLSICDDFRVVLVGNVDDKIGFPLTTDGRIVVEKVGDQLT